MTINIKNELNYVLIKGFNQPEKDFLNKTFSFCYDEKCSCLRAQNYRNISDKLFNLGYVMAKNNKHWLCNRGLQLDLDTLQSPCYIFLLRHNLLESFWEGVSHFIRIELGDVENEF